MSLRRFLVLPALRVAPSCAPRTVVVASTPATEQRPAGPAASGTTPRANAAAGSWRVETREHVDLWLHGFAMLLSDSSLVPTFRLGYRSEASQARRASNITTRLDENALVLSRRLTSSASLGAAQFLALYFSSWDDLRRGCLRFLRDNGDVRAAYDRESVRMYATLATYFPGSAEREFLRLFLESLDDERTRFHRTWWSQQQAARAGMRGQVAAAWSNYARAFDRFLRYSGQRSGTVLLTLPLGAEGRTIDVGDDTHFVAVTFPAASDDPRDAVFVMAHEVVGTVSNQVVRDHTTPAEQQSGESGRLSTLAAVRAGAILLERIAPDLTDGYRRYYLRTARQVPGGDVTAQFARIFPLPGPLDQALVRQVDLVLNGI
ncbi:MAG: hypothetical protein JNJ98_00795 [Gemmatimonadetes bacterium]|nr:hypothetical protein [Gemmatimonadota bacterium]